MLFPWPLDKQNIVLCLVLCLLHGLIGGHGQSQENNTGEFAVSHQRHGQSLKRSRIKHADILLPDESMRALVDISKNDDDTYSDYYDTLDIDPSYYDILDYIYVEDNLTTTVTDFPLTSIETTSTGTSNSQTSTDTDTTSSEVNSSYINGSDNFTAPACDPETHFGCNVLAFERCDTNTKICQCLKGYVREQNQVSKSPCVAAEFFRGHLKVRVTVDSEGNLPDHVIQPIESNLTYYLRLLLEDEDIGGLLNLTMYMPTMTPLNKHGVLSLTFDVAMRQGSLERRHEIRDIWQTSLDSNSKPSQAALRDLLEILGWNSSRNDTSTLFSPLVETNPCHNSEHNYCHAQSRCRVKEGRPSCTCRTGYEDESPDIIQAPGEICSEDCGCENNGVCVTDPNHVEMKQCSCLNWFFGSKCQINGKELLVICCCCLGCLIFVAVLLWCCYYGCVKHKIRATKTNLFSLTPNTNFLKLPRVWMESRYHDNVNDVSPRSIRRMSMASDCNPYFDGFILEDLPPSTLRSQRGEMYGSHYQSQNPGLATVSSHSFFCPY